MTACAASFERVKALGAEAVIDYRTTDFTQQPERCDVVFHCVGSTPYQRCGGVLTGRRVHVTTMPRFRTVMRKLLNPVMRVKVFWLVTVGDGEGMDFVRQLVEDGKLKPIIDRAYPLAEVAAAQE